MGLTNDERNSLVKLRMDKAKRLLEKQSKCMLCSCGI